MRKVSACCLLLLLGCASTAAQKTTPKSNAANHQNTLVKDSVFRSAALQRDMRYRVLLPRDYNKGGRFSVLYLLHGLYGDYLNWDTRTGLENYARHLHLLIVMPDADDSWYTNSATVPSDKFEDYIVKDLISEIDGKYRTIRERHGRAIAGLSMGGYGAVKLGLKYPDLFAFAGSLSGALDAAQNLDTLRPEFAAKLREVFGNEGSRERAENDVMLLLNAIHQTPLPYFYLGCGTADFFLDTNRAFVLQLSSRRIAYEYHETSGEHEWEYWDRELQPMLQVIGRKLDASPQHAPER
jgi:putative tributyrin esterase